ncbi:MAG TPA: TadE family protein [Terracidiphilus sp.]|nr:TadE family protein [Terracidiphilus sp.]
MSRIRRCIVNDAGGALVEVAISSTILFAMFFGVFEIALASYSSHYVSDMAREGARYAIVRGSTSCGNTPNLTNCGANTTTIASYVRGLNYPAINPANLTVTVTYLTGTTVTTSTTTTTTWASCSSGTCNVPGNMVNVAVTYAFGMAIPFVPKKTINVNSVAQMVVQQ